MFPALNFYSNPISQDHDSPISPAISRVHADFGTLNSTPMSNPINPLMNPSHQHQQLQKPKKKRNLPGNPDPDAEVIALSPRTLLATNRFVCEICNKGFQRDQNLQLHRRGHNLPWKLKQRSSREKRKKAYVCPEATCLHHHPSRALGDLTGIKKHFCRKHGEKKWKCEKCSKVYAVQSDWKAHAKTCGTREYRCDCGTLFSRKDSFITHRAFCDALAEESARLSAATNNSILAQNPDKIISAHHRLRHHIWDHPPPPYQNPNPTNIKTEHAHHSINDLDSINPFSPYQDHAFLVPSFGATALHVTGGGPPQPPPLSATALLQRAAAVVGSTHAGHMGSAMAHLDMPHVAPTTVGGSGGDGFTRDFLGLAGEGNEGVKFPAFGFGHDCYDVMMRNQDKGYGFNVETCSSWDKYC